MSAQLGLFEDRTLGVVRARRVLAECLDLETAREELASVRRRGAQNETDETDQLAATVTALEAALAAEVAVDGDLVAALLRLAPTITTSLRPGWHRRIALEAEQRDGVGCRVGPETSGWHLLRAGDLPDAERSLRATLARSPTDARTRAHLADALHRQGDAKAARPEYLRALLDAPTALDWDAIAAPDVAALPALAANEHEAGGDPHVWAAAVGTVEGIFDWPSPALPGVAAPPAEESAPGLRFYHLLCEERLARTLPDRARSRRALKALCPSLLAAYLENWR